MNHCLQCCKSATKDSNGMTIFHHEPLYYIFYYILSLICLLCVIVSIIIVICNWMRIHLDGNFDFIFTSYGSINFFKNILYCCSEDWRLLFYLSQHFDWILCKPHWLNIKTILFSTDFAINSILVYWLGLRSIRHRPFWLTVLKLTVTN